MLLKPTIMLICAVGLLLIAVKTRTREGCSMAKAWPSEYADGRAEALRHLDHGSVTYTIYGEPDANYREFQRLANERYRINLQFGGCCVPAFTDRQRGYNETILAEWKKRYSVPPLEAISRELRNK